ncbi:fibrinogen-like YCDxxxxGGGW domain-containing protein (plasmid) [Pseudomonas sp. FeN3W]|nr:fibrinogen-like YCDxxxxGGGW domain-containing protein [Pseudomonas sp. FeN3W]
MSLKTNNPSLSSGTYTINIAGNEKVVYCDMVTDGGGWTLVGRGVQQRLFGWNSTREAINQNISPSEYSPETFKLSDLDINSIEKAVFKYKYLEALKLAHPNIKDPQRSKGTDPCAQQHASSIDGQSPSVLLRGVCRIRAQQEG